MQLENHKPLIYFVTGQKALVVNKKEIFTQFRPRYCVPQMAQFLDTHLSGGFPTSILSHLPIGVRAPNSVSFRQNCC